MPSAPAIDTDLLVNATITLFGHYGAGYVGVEIIRYRNTVYVPAPYVGLLLCADLSPAEAWNRLHRTIFDATAEAAYWPLINWLCAVIIPSVQNTHSALVFPEPSAPLPNTLLLQHRHQLLLSHLPGIYLSINLADGTHIAETVGEVAVDLRETRLENKRVREKKYNKGATKYFGTNLAHLLNLIQVTTAKDPISSGRLWRGPRSTIISWCYSGPSDHG